MASENRVLSVFHPQQRWLIFASLCAMGGTLYHEEEKVCKK